MGRKHEKTTERGDIRILLHRCVIKQQVPLVYLIEGKQRAGIVGD
jgi:hypothetical protein